MLITLNSENIKFIKDFFQKNDEKNKNENKLTINLEKQEIKCGEKIFHFEIDNAKKYKVLNQIDTISEILKKEKLIADFEKNNEI